MNQLYHDGMAIVRKHGKADMFITFTAHPNLPEVKNALCLGQHANFERYDIISRVFNLKVLELMADI